MKFVSLLCTLTSGAALTIAPFSLELSSSLFVAAGVIALLAQEYATERTPVGQR